MKILSQNNPVWSGKKLGLSQLTIGRFGCTTTSCAMLSDYFGKPITPDWIASHNDWFTPAGLVNWQKFAIPGMAFAGRGQGRDDQLIQACLKDPNRAIMLEVNNGSHWVVALSKTFFGNDYNIADPWDGTKTAAIKKYHNITGAAHWKRA